MPPNIVPLQLSGISLPATRRRALSEDQGADERALKKARVDDTASERATPAKKDKKRRRKKKKAPVTQDDSLLSPTESTQTSAYAAAVLPANSPSSSVAPMAIVPLATKDSKRPEFVEGPSAASSDTLATLTSPCTDSGNVSPPTSASSTVAATVDHKQDILELTQTLSEKTEVSSFILPRMMSVFTLPMQSLRAHKSLLTALLPSLTCQVCLDLLHKPFSLSPCGHVACYSCLINWFTTSSEEPPPGEIRIFRKKTCPHCRATVRERPAEAWGIKEMVSVLVKSRLATGFPDPLDEAGSGDSSGGGTVPRDPWETIFPKLHRPADVHDQDQELFGNYDVEDGVYRCLDCFHEIWNGVCTSCERIYGGHERRGHGAFLWDILGNMAPLPLSDGEDSDDVDRSGSLSGSDDSYGGSFIDDLVIEISSGEEDNPRPSEASRDRRRVHRGLVHTANDGIEEVSSDHNQSRHEVSRRRRMVVIESDGSDDQE